MQLLTVVALLAGTRSARAADWTTPLPSDLLARAASPDPNARLGAVASLGALATAGATSLLVVMLQRDVDPRVRGAAAFALGAADNADVIPALELAAEADWDPNVRAAAQAAARALAPKGRRPKLTAGLSVLCPGCGYFYLRQPGRGLAFLGSTAALIGAGLAVQENTPPNVFGDHPSGRALPLYAAAQNLWFYGIYATYRDARLARGDAGARYPVARETLGELALAPFNPRVLKIPYVWAGLPALIGGVVGYFYILSQFTSVEFTSSTRRLGDPGGVTFFGRRYGTATGFLLGEAYYAGVFDTVAAGEEALFRGVVQAGLSETSLGLWGGWAVGSAIFGAIHTFNFVGQTDGFETAALVVPYITLTGSYLGYVFIKKNFSLLAGTALHFWYDFTLSTISFVLDPDDQPFIARVGFPF